MLTTLEFRFRKQGWKLDVAQDLKAFENGIQKIMPDLVVVDMQMSSDHAMGIIKSVKAGPYKELPLLVLSFLEEAELLGQALKLGANDFLTKPVKPDEMAIRIRRLVP